MTPLFIAGLRLPEILFIVLIVLLLFGGKKIPELMKGIGQGVRSFKEGVSEISKEAGEETREEPKISEKPKEEE
ncbi:MAG: twin-arginine translocase TatA/TatE family subunit [Rikenellaceae bacterium]